MPSATTPSKTPAKLTTSRVESREGRSAHRSPPRGGDREDRPSSSVSPQRRPMKDRLESTMTPPRRRQAKLSSNDLVSPSRSSPKPGRRDSRDLTARRLSGEMERPGYTSLEELSSPDGSPQRGRLSTARGPPEQVGVVLSRVSMVI